MGLLIRTLLLFAILLKNPSEVIGCTETIDEFFSIIGLPKPAIHLDNSIVMRNPRSFFCPRYNWPKNLLHDPYMRVVRMLKEEYKYGQLRDSLDRQLQTASLSIDMMFENAWPAEFNRSTPIVVHFTTRMNDMIRDNLVHFSTFDSVPLESESYYNKIMFDHVWHMCKIINPKFLTYGHLPLLTEKEFHRQSVISGQCASEKWSREVFDSNYDGYTQKTRDEVVLGEFDKVKNGTFDSITNFLLNGLPKNVGYITDGIIKLLDTGNEKLLEVVGRNKGKFDPPEFDGLHITYYQYSDYLSKNLTNSCKISLKRIELETLLNYESQRH